MDVNSFIVKYGVLRLFQRDFLEEWIRGSSERLVMALPANRSIPMFMSKACFLLLLLCLVTITVAPVVNSRTRSSDIAVPERLEITQTIDGPIVKDLFGRFEYASPPPIDCLSNVTCPLGSQPGNTCCNGPGYKSITIQCHPGICNAATCSATDLPKCCGYPCIDTYPQGCVGCSRTGSCS